MANGLPISAIVGKAKYMRKIEEIFFSGTYLGETISMASALATIKFMEIHKLQKTISNH
jgi:glutamate-1-semialdehyde 2,1-aminomutase